MSDALSELADLVARSVTRATGLPFAVSDARGKLLSTTADARSFCPLLAWEGDAAPPLPAACEGCGREKALLAGQPDRLPHCPHGRDAVRAIFVGEALAGFVLTPVLPREFHQAAERAGKALDLAEIPLAAAIATERREVAVRAVLSGKLLAANAHAARAIERLPAGSEARREMELAKAALERACDALRAFQAAPRPAAEVAVAAGEAISAERGT